MSDPNNHIDPLHPQPDSSPETSEWQGAEGESAPEVGGTQPEQPATVVQETTKHPPRVGRYRIQKFLGQGSYGRVYLAYDDVLKRPVAVKVPHRHLVSSPEDIERYIAEARVLASLDHPNIVPVHDAGPTEDGLCCVVSKVIEGNSLAARIKDGPLPHREAAELVAAVAEALHHAHRKGLVHRDIKPSNILLDATGRPYVADFGLALKEENLGKGPQFVGTVLYMSPEQARGEGHRVDGRSDVFSLGVVFYELLTGRHPFRAETQDELLERITTFEARPPRQLNDAIPKELERICLKALSKRASERYTTARDMAEDLRLFLAEPGAAPVAATPFARQAYPSDGAAAGSTRPPNSSSESQPVRIVPKGLRSFDAHDADFFLELLPGPRDREGLPDSIRFWKTRIEEIDPDNTFSVGLIYGPSGCGKSSLVKAGLLPRLAEHVLTVYVEATANETESRLLNALRRRCPDLVPRPSLKDSIAALRLDQGLPKRHKVLIILDQFEQWLHARAEAAGTDLVQALRQCDGVRVQCVVMVRDDFWMAVTRFMRELEIRLVEGQNSATVDLFDADHGRRVLDAFGRAFGRLSEQPGETAKDQKEFLKEAVSGLAQEDKIICVRLALFAEMMKGRPWTPASLKAVGGTEGIGVTFLEETFSAATAPPEHRYHQKAARSVLKSFLRESGTDIKGLMRSYQELLEASGYAHRPTDFTDLISILDRELRLITPTDPEEKATEGDSQSSTTTGQKYYQLTHDYMVPSLRDWLTHKQKETRRGRAELLLADRASVWNARPENRQLPSVFQWASIRLLTRKKDWTGPQRKMMRKAGKYHVFRGCVVAAILAVLSWGSYEGYGRLKAAGHLEHLLDANITEVPQIVEEIGRFRPWVNTLLEKAKMQAEESGDTRRQLLTSLALLPVDPSHVDYLFERLLNAEPQEVPVIRDALTPHREALAEKLWAVVEHPPQGKESQRLRAACALATYEPHSQGWERVKKQVADDLVKVPAVYLGIWMESLRPVRSRLVAPLAATLRDANRGETERSLATDILADYAAEQAALLADVVMDADEKQFAVLFPKLKGHGEGGTKPLLAEIDRQLQRQWTDPPLNSAWQKPDATLVQKIESAQGILVERFAFCQTMPLDDFAHVVETLWKSGYRPTRFRPYPVGTAVHVAAVWTRDGQDFRMAHGLSAEELAKRDANYRKKPFQPVDVSGYISGNKQRYAALWVRAPSGAPATELEVGVDGEQWQEKASTLRTAGYRTEALSLFVASDGKTKVSAIHTKVPGEGTPYYQLFLGIEPDYSGENFLGDLQMDVQVSKAAPLPTTEQRFTQQSAEAVKRLQPLYAAVWHSTYTLFTSTEVHGLDSAAHLVRCRALVAQGYRPACVSVAEIQAGQLVAASVWHRPVVSESDREKLAKRQASAAVALVRMDRLEKVWPLLKHSDDPTLRSYLVHRLSSLGADATVVLKRLDEESDLTIRRALVLALGEFGEEAIPPGERVPVVAKLRDWYRNDPDPGLHAATEWALRQWKQDQWLTETEQEWRKDNKSREKRQQDIRHELSKDKGQAKPQWYVNGQGQTMVVIPGPVEFFMGSPTSEPGRFDQEQRHRRRIGRTFAIAAKAVTVEQFLRFQKQHSFARQYAPTNDCPVVATAWYQAAEYCNWLSEQDGLPKTEWCYEPNKWGRYEEGMRPASDFLKRTGYRLPTEAEWEYACRAGAVTSRYYGQCEELLTKYGWYLKNSGDHTWPVGSLKPNDLGLFDMYGNAWAWCHDAYGLYRSSQSGKAVDDEGDPSPLLEKTIRVLRGGAFNVQPRGLRSAHRNRNQPGNRNNVSFGIRPARTCN